MKQFQSKHLTTVTFLLLIAAAFLVGYQLRDQVGGPLGIRPVWASLATPTMPAATLDRSISLQPVQLFREALDRVSQEYVEPIQDPSKLVYSAVRGMLLPLNDPYTRFMDPKEYTEFNSDNRGNFVGIGATLDMEEIPALKTKEGEGTVPPVICPSCGAKISDIKHYRIAIVEPLPGSPALKAGVKAGDFIQKVNDAPVDGLTVSEVADRIRGPKDTQVTLVLQRRGEEKPLTVTITRAQIEVPSLKTSTLDGNIGYLHLLVFNEKTSIETRAALETFKKENVRGLVLDLRNNPGGLMMESIRVASMLLPADKQVIVSTKDRRGQVKDNKRLDDQIFDLPLVVLVNKGSASASEILSGALKDYHRGNIIGETTFGKALVQTVIPLSDGSAMAITTAHYYTPNGNDIGHKGINPDTAVELDKDVRQVSETDNQAQAAIRILKEEMAKN